MWLRARANDRREVLNAARVRFRKTSQILVLMLSTPDTVLFTHTVRDTETVGTPLTVNATLLSSALSLLPIKKLLYLTLPSPLARVREFGHLDPSATRRRMLLIPYT